MSRPSFGCCQLVQIHLGKPQVARWQGGKKVREVERTYIDALLSSGR